MAIDLSVVYPGQVDTGDPGYPYGKARNQSVVGDGTGTPMEKSLVQDFTGFLQSLLVAGRTTPNGTPDAVGASQYLDALKKLLQPLAVLSWDQPMKMSVQNILPVEPASNQAVTIAPNINDLAVDTLVASPDGGNTWGPVTLASPTGVIFLTGAMDPSGVKGIFTGSKGGGTDIQTSAALGSFPIGAFAPITPPGTPTELHCALFDPNTSRFIVTGKTGSAPYIATCELADLTTWTQRTVPASITGSKNALGLCRIGTTIVASWDDQTKVAYSTDGVTWTASTTTLTSAQYRVEAGETKFLAVSKNSGKVYNSTDGITWTAQPDLSRPEANFEKWGFKFLGGLFLLRCTGTGAGQFSYSADNGATWVTVREQNRTWVGMGVIRHRLVQFRYLPSGSDVDVWIERSLPVAMPGT